MGRHRSDGYYDGRDHWYCVIRKGSVCSDTDLGVVDRLHGLPGLLERGIVDNRRNFEVMNRRSKGCADLLCSLGSSLDSNNFFFDFAYLDFLLSGTIAVFLSHGEIFLAFA